MGAEADPLRVRTGGNAGHLIVVTLRRNNNVCHPGRWPTGKPIRRSRDGTEPGDIIRGGPDGADELADTQLCPVPRGPPGAASQVLL